MTVYDHVAGSVSQLDAQVIAAVPPGGNWRDLPEDFPSERVDQIRRSAAAGEGSRSTYYGRLDPGRPSYTISTYFSRPGNGCFIHPSAPRLITVREAARLQSFPDRFRFVGRGRARYKQVGNAVPPLLARAIGDVLPAAQVVDLFSGVGGLSFGLSLAGHDVILAADHDRTCVEAMREHGHAARVECADLGDASVVAALASRVANTRDRAVPLLLAGGPPCQGFSTAGRNDAQDPRNRLAFSFLDAVDLIEPDVVLMENVPALMWRGRRHVLEALVLRLESRGYTVDVSILHAEAYGIPQLRRRLVLQASLGGNPAWPMPLRRLSDPAQPSLQPGAALASDLAAATTVGEALEDLPLEPSSSADDPVSYVSPVGNSRYAAWARGELGLDEFLPTEGPVLGGQAQLKLAVAA